MKTKTINLMLLAIALCTQASISARHNKQQIFLANSYKNVDGQGSDVGVTMLWKDSAFPYRTQQQDIILKGNQQVTMFKAPYSTQYLTEIYAVPAENLNLTWAEYADAKNIKTVLRDATMAGGLTGLAIGIGGGSFFAGAALDGVSLNEAFNEQNFDNATLQKVINRVNKFDSTYNDNVEENNKTIFYPSDKAVLDARKEISEDLTKSGKNGGIWTLAAAAAIGTIAAFVGGIRSIWNLADIKKGKNRATVHEPHHTFFNIEDIAQNSQVKNQTQIGIKEYESEEKYAQELEKTAPTA